MDDTTRTAFCLVFASEQGKIVLQHLAEFAHADEAEFCNDPRKSDYLLGQRSVVQYIRNILKE